MTSPAGADVPLVSALRRELAAAGDPLRAPAMQAYMKSTLPYHGVPMPVVRKLSRALFTAHPLPTVAVFEATVAEIFTGATHREERYAAVQLAEYRAYATWQTAERLPLYRTLILDGAWWDTVDEIAGNLIGPILLAQRAEVTPVLLSWTTDPDLWLRRTAILAQLNAREATDLELLTAAIDANADDREFFLRKAIGWALRQYARTDPDWVRRFVATRPNLSGLSRREALKHL